MTRTKYLTRSALGLALALGTVSGAGLTSAPALAKSDQKADASSAPKVSASKGFLAVAVPLNQAIEKAKVRADVIAARQQADAANSALRAARGDARKPAQANYDSAVAALGGLLTAEKGQVDGMFNAVTSPDDKFVAGQVATQLGVLSYDTSLQRRGIGAMVDSGKLAPAEAQRMGYFLGSLAYDAQDYPAVVKALTPVVAGNYSDDSAAELLAEAYALQSQYPQALDSLRSAVAARKAAGGAVPSSWLMRANQIAYKAKLGNEAIQWSLMLAENDPTPINWLAAGQIIRDFGNFTNQESLDLGRLLMRQGAINADPRFSEREYVEYIQAADPRRLPAEVIKVAEAGIAKGALRANDTFVADALNQARGRIAADKASLAGLDRDAHAPSATAVTAMAAGDAFMSYDNAVKAEEFYKIALGKSGVDTPRILTRLGIAQSDQGKYADALATFGKIDGTRKPLAQLWMLYVNQKSKPAS